MSDLYAVRLCNDIYDIPDAHKWGELWNGTDPDGIYAAITGDVLVFRGSDSLEDWLRDLLAAQKTPYTHPQFGPIHSGFWMGMQPFFDKVRPVLKPGMTICGHSLGAARAWLFAALMVAAGIEPAKIITCGSPRPGCLPLRQFLDKARIPTISLKNRHDPVTDVPIKLPTWPYMDMADFTVLDADPDPLDLTIFADHHMPLYIKGYTAYLVGDNNG